MVLRWLHISLTLVSTSFELRALQALECQSHGAFDLSLRTGDDFAGDALQVRVKIRLQAPHRLVQRGNPLSEVRHFRVKLGRFRGGIGLDLFNLPAGAAWESTSCPRQEDTSFSPCALNCAPVSKACRCSFSIPARTCCCVVSVSSFDNTCARCSTNAVHRQDGAETRLGLHWSFARWPISPIRASPRTVPRLLQDARPQVLPQALPPLLLQLGWNMPK